MSGLNNVKNIYREFFQAARSGRSELFFECCGRLVSTPLTSRWGWRCLGNVLSRFSEQNVSSTESLGVATGFMLDAALLARRRQLLCSMKGIDPSLLSFPGKVFCGDHSEIGAADCFEAVGFIDG